jgi:hypothetical protein
MVSATRPKEPLRSSSRGEVHGDDPALLSLRSDGDERPADTRSSPERAMTCCQRVHRRVVG